MKTCNECKQKLPRSAFQTRRSSPDGLQYKCRSCLLKVVRAWERKNPTRKRRHRQTARFRKYNLTVEEATALLASQDGACAICEKVLEGKDCHVDHCHSTGQVRGMLCMACNLALGSFKDDPELLRRAIEYVTRSCVRAAS